MIDFFSATSWFSIARAGVILFIGFVLAKLVSLSINKFFGKHLSAHHATLAKRASFYLIIVLFTISAMRELGFNLSVLIGAAGILTVALGFASQTSASNLISGLFLLGEKPFEIGDVIRVNSTTGEVLSIDLLSVKLRTFDNLFVRIPNETMLKSEVTTLTRFPIRRIDLLISFSYKEDIEQVEKLLLEVADKNPLCLEEPKPQFIFQGYGTSSLDSQLSVWAKRENFLAVKNALFKQIKITFDQHGVEIPFPQLHVHTDTSVPSLKPEKTE